MRRTLPSAILLGLLLATAGAGAEKLAAIRATTFRVTDPERVREIEAADEWHRRASRGDAESLSRDTWLALASLAAEQHNREAGAEDPQISDDDLQELLESMGFEGSHDGVLEDPGPRVERLNRLDRARDARIFDATRGLTPSLVQECVVSEGHEAAAAARDPESRMDFTTHFRVAAIQDERVRMKVLTDWGGPMGLIDPGVEGFAPAYPIGVPLLTERSGFRGATVDWTLRFLEIQRVTSAPHVNSCTVSYPAGGKPPPAPPARGRPDSGSRVFGISGAASPADTD